MRVLAALIIAVVLLSGCRTGELTRGVVDKPHEVVVPPTDTGGCGWYTVLRVEVPEGTLLITVTDGSYSGGVTQTLIPKD
jgi:hypothetical protein